MVADASPNRIWLHGPVPDLLLGSGLLYLILLAAMVAAGEQIRALQPAVLFPLLTLVIGGPHYGATLVRVYEQRHERRAYAIFSVWATALVFAAFLVSMHVAIVGSLMLTLYLTWSPWHYTGQNYGIAVMFLKRGGVAINALDKRLLYFSYVLSFGVTFLVLHSLRGGADDLTFPYSGGGLGHVSFMALGLPRPLTSVLVPGMGLAYLAVLGAVVVRLMRRAPIGRLAPALLLSVSQGLWFVLPASVLYFSWELGVEAFDPSLRGHYFVWIATAHSAQYLWVTSYFAGRTGNWHGLGPYFIKVLLAGAAIWTIPKVLFGPDALGTLSLGAGLAALVASAVNIHHFVLDGAIWKLRGRIAEILIRARGDTSADTLPARSGLRRVVWTVCLVGGLMDWFHLAEREVSRRAASRQDYAGVQASQDRLRLLGLDHAVYRERIGKRLLREGQVYDAEAQLLRSLEIDPQPAAGISLALAYGQQGRHVEAATTLEALALESGKLEPMLRASDSWLAAGRPEQAQHWLERAREIAPNAAGVAKREAKIQSALAEAEGGS